VLQRCGAAVLQSVLQCCSSPVTRWSAAVWSL